MWLNYCVHQIEGGEGVALKLSCDAIGFFKFKNVCGERGLLFLGPSQKKVFNLVKTKNWGLIKIRVCVKKFRVFGPEKTFFFFSWYGKKSFLRGVKMEEGKKKKKMVNPFYQLPPL